MSQSLSRARRPLAVFCNGIGDHLLTLPSLRALAQIFAGRLELACLPGARELFFSDLPLREAHELAVIGSQDGVIAFDAGVLAKKAQAASVGDCDLLIVLNRALPHCVVDLLERIRPAASIGLFPEFSIPVPFRRGIHAADLAFDMVRQFDPTLEVESFACPPTLAAEHAGAARQLRSLLPEGSQLLAVHAETAPEKMWPLPRFHELLQWLLAKHPELWVLLLGEGRECAEALAAQRVINCCGLPLAASFAMVAEADWFIGIDSCLLHAADLFRTPAVALFGPTCPEEFGLRFGPGIHVRPAQSLEAISVQEALAAVSWMRDASLLSRRGRRPIQHESYHRR